VVGLDPHVIPCLLLFAIEALEGLFGSLFRWFLLAAGVFWRSRVLRPLHDSIETVQSSASLWQLLHRVEDLRRGRGDPAKDLRVSPPTPELAMTMGAKRKDG
jgi:hypothetical protein